MEKQCGAYSLLPVNSLAYYYVTIFDWSLS